MEKSMNLILRALEPTDWEDWWEIRVCPQVMRQTLGLPYTSKTEAKEKLANPPPGFLSIVAEVGGKMVGQCALHTQRGRRSHVGSVGMMVHDDYVGRGIGTALLGATIDLAENWLGLTRLELEVFADNEAAIHLYQKFGFVIEGTKRRYARRDGDLVDTHIMGRLKDE